MGFECKDNSNRKNYILRLNISLYGLKLSSYNWFTKLKTGLENRVFVKSSVNHSVFYNEGYIVLTYVDDCIIIGDTSKRIYGLINHFAGGEVLIKQQRKYRQVFGCQH